MRPESASLRLQGMTHAKSRMYEFNVPEELHVDIRGNDPSHLFPLVMGRRRGRSHRRYRCRHHGLDATHHSRGCIRVALRSRVSARLRNIALRG